MRKAKGEFTKKDLTACNYYGVKDPISSHLKNADRAPKGKAHNDEKKEHMG